MGKAPNPVQGCSPHGPKSYCPPGKGPLRIPTLVAARPRFILKALGLLD